MRKSKSKTSVPPALFEEEVDDEAKKGMGRNPHTSSDPTQETFERGEEIKSFKCPKCGINLFSSFVLWLSKFSGLSKHELENGALNELDWRLKISQRVLTVTGVKLTEEQITEKTAEKVLGHVEKIFSEKLLIVEKEKYEQQIESLKKLMEERIKSKDELIKELEKSRRDLNEKEIEKLQEKTKYLEEQNVHKDKDYEELERQYKELLAKVKHVPTIAGGVEELDVLKRLESVCQDIQDKFYREGSNSLGEDLYSRVIDNNQEVERVVIEVKKVKDWQDKYLDQTRGYMHKHKTICAMVATKTMPGNALNNALFITEDGLWVVREDLLEFGYRALREFIVSAYREKLTEKQAQEAMRLFKEKILTEKYQGRLLNIAMKAEKIENISKQLQKSTEIKCESMRIQTKEIIIEVNQLIEDAKEIMKQVKSEGQKTRGDEVAKEKS